MTKKWRRKKIEAATLLIRMLEIAEKGLQIKLETDKQNIGIL